MRCRTSGCVSAPVPACRGVLPAHECPGAGSAARLGAVAFIHRFGSTLNPHLHFHCVVIDGVFDAAAAGEVIFHAATGLDATAIAEVQAQVRRRLLRLFVRRGLLPADGALAMAQWEHGGGFSVDASVRIAAADRTGRERLLRYCARPPLALGRLRELDPERLLYESIKPGPSGNGPLLLTPLQLLDRLAALVPPPRIHRHRYFGVLAPHSPLRSAVTALARAATTSPPAPKPQPAAEPAHRRAARYAWAALLARIYEVFPPCARSAAPRCASSPSSPTHLRSTTSSSTWASRRHHPGSRPPAARRYRTCPRPERVASTPKPSRHRSTSSINASLGNPSVDCRSRTTPDRRMPTATRRAR